MDAWDREVDVLVVGTGAAGLSAAIAAADAGLETLVVESTSLWGGSTNLSGGGAWMPTNPLMSRIGVEDSVEETLTYLDACVGDVGPASSPERRRAFVETVPEVFHFFRRRGVRWFADKDYPDYYPDLPGGKIGRTLEVEPFDTKLLGAWFETARTNEGLPPIPLMTDDVWQLQRAWSTVDGFGRGARLVSRTLWGFARGKRLAGMGLGLGCSLMQALQTQGVEVLLSTPLTELVSDGGAVVGAVVHPDGAEPWRIRTRRGVVLAAGGFGQNRAMRKEHHGIEGWTSAAEGNLGTAIELGEGLGAKLELMDDAWWGFSVPDPDGNTPMFTLAERSFPFGFIVDQGGERYVNESASYVDVAHAMLERNKHTPAIPSWLIVDARHRRRYLFAALMQGSGRLEDAGIVKKAETVEALADALGMDRDRLQGTIGRFNGFAKTGVDEDFGRGNTAYDRYYSDPRVGPNPNLGAVERGPLTAIKLVPGDLGTKGGLLCDEDSRVLGTDGAPIEGLYAAGNSSASPMGRTYPGAGATIGPAMVFGYRAAKHMARG